MPELCQNCGAEFYAGQQFCRRCGTPVSAGGATPPAAEAPTQLFPGGAPTSMAQPAVGTSPLGGGRTDPVGPQQPTAYQPPLAAFQQTSSLHPARPPRRRRGAWLAALLVVFMLGAGLASGAAYLWWRSRPRPIAFKHVTKAPAAPAVPVVPDVPEHLGERVKEALKGAVVPPPLDESGAVVSGDTTTLTRNYELGDDSSFAVRVVKGSVTVTGTDDEAVVVKIVKRGGSAAERGAARVLEAKSEEGLTLLTTPGAPSVSVSYEVAVPRHMRRLEIEGDRADVRVSGFAGAVVSDIKTGNAEFRDVSGEVRSKVIKGNTKVFQGEAEREGSQQFSVVKGDIEATFDADADADIKAETLGGRIEGADGFGLRVESARAGRHLAGRLGGGGEALVFKVTDGDIRLKK